MTLNTIKTSVEDNILTITLNRPDRLNAFNTEMQFELIDTFRAVNDDDEIRAVVITGEGRGFCAGKDLKDSGADSFDVKKRPDYKPHTQWRDGGGRVALAVYDCLKPVIAAVNGPAVGVGITMLLPMDIRLASSASKFGFVFAKRGLVMEACSSWFLPRLVGIQQAAEWVYTGRVFPAAEALKGGLVSEVLEPDELLPRAYELAREMIDGNSPVAVALMRQMIWRMMAADHPIEAHKVDSRGISVLGKMPDTAEGISSFLEKRPPNFPMKVSKDMPGYYPWWDEPRFQ